MTNKLFFSLFLMILISFAGCKKDDTSGIDFTLNFDATYNGSRLVKNNTYTFGDYPLLFQRFRMYVSDITLLKGDKEVKIADVAYLDFTQDLTKTDTTEVLPLILHHVPADSYDAIRIGFGVNPVNNAKRPSDFKAPNPLASEVDYWQGWKSYIFMILDGKADPDKDGVKNLNFSYHCGSDAVYTVNTYTLPIQVSDQTRSLDISFDVLKLLTNDDGSLFDIQAQPITSNGVDDTRVAKVFMDHLYHATSLKQ